MLTMSFEARQPKNASTATSTLDLPALFFPIRTAVSIGHGDTMLLDKLSEDLDRLSPVESLAWSAIQFYRYSIKFVLGVQGQVGAFREVLAEQPVGVLVGGALLR